MHRWREGGGGEKGRKDEGENQQTMAAYLHDDVQQSNHFLH